MICLIGTVLPNNVLRTLEGRYIVLIDCDLRCGGTILIGIVNEWGEVRPLKVENIELLTHLNPQVFD